MPLTIAQLQEQIFQREGFRVTFERLDAAKREIPAYDFSVMAPSTWKVSDWRSVRLAKYIALFRGVTVFRGDGEPQRSDVKLAHLRDGYYKAEYGTTEPDPTPVQSSVTSIDSQRKSNRKKRAEPAEES